MTFTPLLGLCFAFPRLTEGQGFPCSSPVHKQSTRAAFTGSAPAAPHRWLHSGSLGERVNHFKQWSLAWLGRTHDKWVIHEFMQVVIYSLDLSWNIARGGVWSFQVKSRWLTCSVFVFSHCLCSPFPMHALTTKSCSPVKRLNFLLHQISSFKINQQAAVTPWVTSASLCRYNQVMLQ